MSFEFINGGVVSVPVNFLTIPESYFFSPYWLLMVFLGLAFLFGLLIGIISEKQKNGEDILYDFLQFTNNFR